MVTQKLVETYMLVSDQQSRVKYEVFAGDEDLYALVTVFGDDPDVHIVGYDSSTLSDSEDIRSQIEEHFAATYP